MCRVAMFRLCPSVVTVDRGTGHYMRTCGIPPQKFDMCVHRIHLGPGDALCTQDLFDTCGPFEPKVVYDSEVLQLSRKPNNCVRGTGET
jgi:hypothetical protein